MVTIYHKLNLKLIASVLLGTMVLFVLFDPYLWSDPVDHLYAIFGQFIHFRKEVGYEAIVWTEIYKISVMALASIVFFFLYRTFSRRENNVIYSYYPLYVQLALTFVFYAILLTSNSRAPRYFLPIVLSWQAFLPLFMIYFFNKVNLESITLFKKQRKKEIFMQSILAILLIGYEAAIVYAVAW